MARMLALASPLRWRRFAQLEVGQRRLLREAAVRLAMASAMLRLLPFDRAVRSSCAPLGGGDVEPQDVARAIGLAADVLPWRVMCLERGLACQAMLRQRGADARLHYGVAMGERLEAHAWVTVGGEAVIGGAEAARFEELVRFPD